MGWMVRLFARASIISDILVETKTPISSISAAASGNDSSSIDKQCEQRSLPDKAASDKKKI